MHFKSNYEIVIIGSGAGCGALMKTLASNGYAPSDILILERGGYMPEFKSAASRFVNSYENS